MVTGPEGSAFVNITPSTQSPIVVSGSKRERPTERTSIQENHYLVGHSIANHSEEHAKAMEPKETTRLYYGKHSFDTIRINGPKQQHWDAESMSDDFRFLTVDPAWMNVRLFVFWFLWAMLIIVLIASVLSYCCLLPLKCTRPEGIFLLNTTNI